MQVHAAPQRQQFDELDAAMIQLIQMDQSKTFAKEWKQYSKNECFTDGTIWLDPTHHILRLRGRVVSDNLTLDEQYPILLSRHGHLAKVLIHEAHLKTLHGGVQQVLQITREKFCVICECICMLCNTSHPSGTGFGCKHRTIHAGTPAIGSQTGAGC